MARTKASVGAKISSGKSSKARCSAAPPPATPGTSGSSERSSRSYSGGNPVCQRETPKWQRPITNFFMGKSTSQSLDSESEDEVAARGSKQKGNVIESDDEEVTSSTKEEIPEEKPKNTELDETLELEPLTGEDSHKIEEYYTKNGKGKGKGKKTNKENIDSNIEQRKSAKRDFEDAAVEEENHVSKKVKVN